LQRKQSRAALLPVLMLAVCLALGGCAALAVTDQAPQADPVPPDKKRLTELINAAFQMAKFSGTPEVSALHATHAPQGGDWMFCIKSDAPKETAKDAVFIRDNGILNIRSGVVLDGCNKDTYRPVTPP
jgi:hypothetical protein